MSSNNMDQNLKRIKDFLLIISSVATWIFLGFGFIALPERMQKAEADIVSLTSYENKNDLNIQSIQKDVAYIAQSFKEFKNSMDRK